MITEKLKKADTIPQEVVDIIKTSVINTFGSICGGEPVCTDQDEITGSLNGMIGNVAVFNPELTLSLMMAIPKDTAIAISESFLGMELPFESHDMGDMVAEIANILAGEVAANIETIGFRGQSSLPTATRGSDLTLFMPSKPPSARMKFVSSSGDFMLNMVLSESR